MPIDLINDVENKEDKKEPNLIEGMEDINEVRDLDDVNSERFGNLVKEDPITYMDGEGNKVEIVIGVGASGIMIQKEGNGVFTRYILNKDESGKYNLNTLNAAGKINMIKDLSPEELSTVLDQITFRIAEAKETIKENRKNEIMKANELAENEDLKKEGNLDEWLDSQIT